MFDCHLSPDWRQMAIKYTVSSDFDPHSSIVLAAYPDDQWDTDQIEPDHPHVQEKFLNMFKKNSRTIKNNTGSISLSSLTVSKACS